VHGCLQKQSRKPTWKRYSRENVLLWWFKEYYGLSYLRFLFPMHEILWFSEISSYFIHSNSDYFFALCSALPLRKCVKLLFSIEKASFTLLFFFAQNNYLKVFNCDISKRYLEKKVLTVLNGPLLLFGRGRIVQCRGLFLERKKQR
jgi:hypothetical protein